MREVNKIYRVYRDDSDQYGVIEYKVLDRVGDMIRYYGDDDPYLKVINVNSIRQSVYEYIDNPEGTYYENPRDIIQSILNKECTKQDIYTELASLLIERKALQNRLLSVDDRVSNIMKTIHLRENI